MKRSYYAKELTTFGKLEREKSHCGTYMLIGFYNNTKTKFKDIASGNIYDVKDVKVRNGEPSYFIKNNTEIETRAIEIDGEFFVPTEFKIMPCSCPSKTRYMEFSGFSMFSRINPEPFAEVKGKSGYPYLYYFAEKTLHTPHGVVTGEEVRRATEEVNHYADSWIYEKKESGVSDDFWPYPIGEYPSLTEEEREF